MASVFDIDKSVHIKVDFYDEEERQKLLLYPTAEKLTKIVSSGIDVPMAQFLTYYLFHLKRPGKDGYRNYTELERKIGRAVVELEDWVYFQDNSLVSAPDVTRQVNSITERIGEAASLSLMGHLHDLHNADWERIPEERGRKANPTFDYQDVDSASDGERIIQVEAKGTAVEDSQEKTPSVSTHKRNIDLKKSGIRLSEQDGKYKHHADLRYAVICSIGHRGPLYCRLTDPPADVERNPRRYRLLKRIEFMFNWISFLSGRSQLAASLASRLHALQTLDDPFSLANTPLLRGNGKLFEFAIDPFIREQGIFSTLCQVTDGPTVGTILRLPDSRLFFLGVQKSIYEMAASQSFNTILTYSNTAGSIRKTIRCRLSRTRARDMGIIRLHTGSASSAYISFNAEGLLHYSQGAVVFGIVESKS